MEQPQDVINVVNTKFQPGAAKLSADDCRQLKTRIPTAQVPSECEQILQQARASGVLLPTRVSQGPMSSKVTETWSNSAGHGKRSYSFDTDGVDNGKEYTVDEKFLDGKTPEMKEKIRQLRTRMSARGALNVTGVNLAEVQMARKQEMERRQSRRDELNSKVKH